MSVPWWYMKRQWLDQEAGIESVAIHYTWTPLEFQPDWNQHRETRVMEKNGTIKEGMGGTVLVELATQAVHERQANAPENARIRVLKIPTLIWDPRSNSPTDHFLLHHYFEVHQNGHVWNTDQFSEEIISREVEYVDWSGNVVGTCAHWSLYDQDASQYCPSELAEFIERFGDDHEFRSPKFYNYQDRSRFLRSKALMLREIPLPHRWKSRVWGPAGAKVIQGWHVGYLDEIPPEWETVQMREEWVGYGEFHL